MQDTLKCRFCGEDLVHTFVDLGETPLANSYLKDEAGIQREKKWFGVSRKAQQTRGFAWTQLQIF